jgi:5-methylcytosine-specific restriction protein A
MGKAAAKACKHPGCGVAVRDGTSRCPKHPPREKWVQKAPYKRITGRRLQKLRADLFEREPLCRMCAAKGFVTLACIRDHIKPHAEGGTDDDENIQPLCQACSDEKTEGERRRGIATTVHQFGARPSPQGVGGGQKSGTQ